LRSHHQPTNSMTMGVEINQSFLKPVSLGCYIGAQFNRAHHKFLHGFNWRESAAKYPNQNKKRRKPWNKTQEKEKRKIKRGKGREREAEKGRQRKKGREKEAEKWREKKRRKKEHERIEPTVGCVTCQVKMTWAGPMRWIDETFAESTVVVTGHEHAITPMTQRKAVNKSSQSSQKVTLISFPRFNLIRLILMAINPWFISLRSSPISLIQV